MNEGGIGTNTGVGRYEYTPCFSFFSLADMKK